MFCKPRADIDSMQSQPQCGFRVSGVGVKDYQTTVFRSPGDQFVKLLGPEDLGYKTDTPRRESHCRVARN